ncbi:uncharacterized protein LOC124553738 isoform X2 [Schistocerca americana]|uniref:uncharacterized protein LOC124553738 isoform X2 n=1 Tax=Schistocerca americana TaxID=7009 RepID=UPI001F4FDC5D|nr:uncharacterized protein LOC124553738 isoform X2 [Schistocerca americana]
MCSSNSNVFSGDEVMQNYDLGRKDFVYMKEMDEIFENKTNIYPEILLDGANVVAEAATTNQPSDQAAPGPSGYSTKCLLSCTKLFSLLVLMSSTSCHANDRVLAHCFYRLKLRASDVASVESNGGVVIINCNFELCIW